MFIKNTMDPNKNQQNINTMPAEGEIPSPGAINTPMVENPSSVPQTPAVPPATLVDSPPQAATTATQPPPPPPPPPPPAPPSPVVSSKSGGAVKKIAIAAVMLIALLGLVFLVFQILRGGLVPGGRDREIVWWGLWEDQEIVAPLIEEYQAQNPGVVINYVRQQKEDYRERLVSAIARGDGPDMFRIHNTWVPTFASELSVAPQSVITPQEFEETFYPVMANDLIGPMGVLGVPLMYDGLTMFINEDIFATYGATIPRTWSEVRDTAKALTVKDDRGVITQAGAALGTTSNVDHWQEIVALLMIQNGADPSKPGEADGRGEQALRFYKQYAQVDQVWDDTLPTSTIAFASGRLAMYFAPSWRIFEIEEVGPNFSYRSEPVPQLPRPDGTASDTTYATYWFEGVSSTSDSAEEAWRFLKFLSQRESLEKLYTNSSRVRLFGEPYPRADMRDRIASDPIVGGVIRLAPGARSGYLASRTFDGASGINTSLAQYYEDALNSIDATRSSPQAMQTLSTGVQQILSRYGLVPPPVATPR